MSLYTCKFDTFQQSEVFRLALKSEDELFHVSLYDWLFTMNMTDKLLEVNTFCTSIFVDDNIYYECGIQV